MLFAITKKTLNSSTLTYRVNMGKDKKGAIRETIVVQMVGFVP